MKVIEDNKHLWEIEHDYYCSPENYFSNDTIDEFKTIDDFLFEYKDSSMDMNLVFRWDWELPEIPSEDKYYRDGTLKIFWMGQRKGLYRCSLIDVCKEDEKKVIDFLKPRFKYLMELWEPIILTKERVRKGKQ